MLLLKRYESKSGKPTIISRLGRRSDNFFHIIFSSINALFSYINKHTAIAFGHWVAFHILVHIRRVYVEIKARFISHPQGKKMIDAVRGRGNVSKEGASFFLRRIAEK